MYWNVEYYFISSLEPEFQTENEVVCGYFCSSVCLSNGYLEVQLPNGFWMFYGSYLLLSFGLLPHRLVGQESILVITSYLSNTGFSSLWWEPIAGAIDPDSVPQHEDHIDPALISGWEPGSIFLPKAQLMVILKPHQPHFKNVCVISQ